MAATEVLGRYSQAGFYETPMSKVLTCWVAIGHAALQVPMFNPLQRFLICTLPDSLTKGEYWRLVTSRVAFIDTKDAILAAILVYTFRIFERRLGSRKFFSHLATSFFLTTILETCVTLMMSSFADKSEFSGLMSVGPLAAVFPWFVPFLHDVPKLKSGSIGGTFFSSKLLTYVAGFHILSSSRANLIAGVTGLAAGLLLRHNVLWSQRWIVIPERLAVTAYKLFGRWIESGPHEQGMMGATLEVQRSQQMDALEQQLLRQQVRYAGGAGGARHRRPHVGQGFAERLVDDAGIDGGWGPFQIPNNRQVNQPPPRPQPPPVPPSEENVQRLMDMGFSRDRVQIALARSNNDVQLATTVLLQEP